LQRIVAGRFSLAGATRCDTSSADGAGDILDLLIRRQLPLARISNKRNSVFIGGLRLFNAFGGGAPLLTTLAAIFETCPEREHHGGIDDPVDERSPTAEAARPPRVECSLDPVFSLRQVFCFVVAAPRRRVLHGGGLLGVVASPTFCFCSVLYHDDGSMSSRVCWWAHTADASSSLWL
jgi:hypothetical protein